MKSITLNTITLIDFGNWKKCEINFDKNTELKANYGYGKTTIYNAFLWVLGLEPFSKVSPTNELLEIPTNVITKVVVDLTIDNENYKLSRASDNKFEINDYKIKSLKNYIEKITYLLGFDLQNLNLLVKNGAFNQDTLRWKWNNRRDFLYNLFGVEEKIKNLKESYSLLKNDFVLKKDNEIDNSFTNDTKTINKQKQMLFENLESKQLEIQKYSETKENELKSEIDKLNEIINQETKNNDYETLNNLKATLKAKEAEFETTQKELQEKINTYEKLKNRYEINQEQKLEKIENEMSKNFELIEQAKKELEECEKRVFVADTICKFCGSKIDPSKIEEQKKHFEETKQNDIEKINFKIKFYNDIYEQNSNVLEKEIEENEKTTTEYKQTIKLLTEELEKQKIKANEERNKLTQKISNLEENKTNNIEEYRKQLNEKCFELGKLNTRNYLQEEINKIENDIKSLNDKEQEILLKREQFKEYIAKSILIVENAINSNFSDGISFKLFNKKLDGTFEPECVTLLNGKPYDNLSFGEKILADFSIIKYLQKTFEVKLPIFIDNANAFTTISENDYQTIALITSVEKEPNFMGVKLEQYYKRKEAE